MQKKIEDYINKSKKPIVIPFGDDFSITVKPFLSVQEEVNFIEEVLEYSYIDIDTEESYSPVSSDVAFHLAFMKYFTNIPIVTKEIEINGELEEIIDSEKMYEIYRALNLLSLINNSEFETYIHRLKILVNKAIEHKNNIIAAQSSIAHANEEAINSFGEVCNSLINMLETLNAVIDKNGSKMLNKITNSINTKSFEKLAALLPDNHEALIEIINKYTAKQK